MTLANTRYAPLRMDGNDYAVEYDTIAHWYIRRAVGPLRPDQKTDAWTVRELIETADPVAARTLGATLDAKLAAFLAATR